MTSILISFLLLTQTILPAVVQQPEPVRIAVAGLTHGHVNWVFADNITNDIEVVGYYEPNRELWERFKNRFGLDESLHFTDLDEMLDQTRPEAVTAFGSTFDHLMVTEAAAPRGIHIMVEKPLAVNLDHAGRMKELADRHRVHLITNYETTWYASNHAAYELFTNGNNFGDIRKVVVHDGHFGPKEIGVSNEFLEWLIDPVLNGGGALMDFGCYGANLITWLMHGQEPLTVTAVTQTHKPHIYGEVDDEATIIVTYPGVQGVIQASWNWPYHRKDMHVYGESGFVYAQNHNTIQVLENHRQPPASQIILDPLKYPFNDPFSYFAAVVRGNVKVLDTDLSSLVNNITVMKILDAARESARTGTTIYLNRE
ncbi:MAG: gfo/Idh/MocA family oxidoreductase [Balneolaceae bacterium]|nr:MAG: gfo/Idh/MocA family oxidoreductase [Balneolaceae bacterium]